MTKLVAFFVLIQYISLISHASAQQRKHEEVTNIIILESKLYESNIYNIKDNIVSIKKINLENNDTTIYIKINKSQIDNLYSYFNHKTLNKLKSVYESKSAEPHDWMYKVTIQTTLRKKDIYIYKYKVHALYCMSINLNKVLPEGFYINYGDRYFK